MSRNTPCFINGKDFMSDAKQRVGYKSFVSVTIRNHSNEQ